MLIIHVADLHLGASPDSGEPWGEERKKELWESFERLLDAAEKEKADLLLIAGDLFHRPPLLRELREVNALFEMLSKTKVVLMAGNHDFAGTHSFYHKFSWAENVYFLGTGELDKVVLKELQTEVYGISYHKKEIRERIYDNLRPEDNGYYHVLLAHGGDEKHIPFSKERLQKSGFDYMAFGHIHNPGMILPGRAVMAGSLEPLENTEEGVHGYVRVKTEHGKQDIALVPFACRAYITLEVEVTPEDTVASLFSRLKNCIEESGEENIYSVVFRGKKNEHLELMEAKLKSAGNIRKIIDETEKDFDYEMLKTHYQGRLLQRYIDSFADADTVVEKRALEIGTEAILEVLGR